MKIYLFLFIILFAGCKEKKAPQISTGPGKEDSLVLNRPLQVPREEVMLLQEPKMITSEWLAYITAQSEINNFQSYSLRDVMQNAGPIAEIMKSLKESLPDTLRSRAVESRLVVLYTKAKVLEQKSNKRAPNLEEISEIAQQIPSEFNNFKIQLNELFLKTLEQFEEELDKFETERQKDSISPLIREIPLDTI